jgi:GDPmannose 4,6-dehydratase
LKRRAIIVGSKGQDGRLLSNLLTDKGYELVLVSKGDPDILNRADVSDLVSRTNPDEIYFLAAHHHSSEDEFESDVCLFRKSSETHVISAVNFLEAIASKAPSTRFFYASSSHIFPHSTGHLLNEETAPAPENIYAITKLAGMMACRFYRDKRKVFVSCGILFNHESALRPPTYLSRKVAIAAARIFKYKTGTLVLGDLDAVVDWGYASDYVEAMFRVLQLEYPSDYVIASGEAHTVRQFVEIAFSHLGLDYTEHVKLKSELLSKHMGTRIGDPSRLKADTGWNPTVKFEDMVRMMVDAELVSLR